MEDLIWKVRNQRKLDWTPNICSKHIPKRYVWTIWDALDTWKLFGCKLFAWKFQEQLITWIRTCGRLMAGSRTTAITHEKKGKWFEPNLQGIMFHVNLQGCNTLTYIYHMNLFDCLSFVSGGTKNPQKEGRNSLQSKQGSCYFQV